MKSSIFYGLFLFSLFLIISTLQLGQSRLTYDSVQQQIRENQPAPQMRRGEVSIVAQMQRPMLFPEELDGPQSPLEADSSQVLLPVSGE